MDYKITSRSIEDTMELAENIESEKFPGMIICLDGELGSGKTVFVKGFAKSLGIEENITSPTFNINLDTYSLKRSNDTGTGSSYINLIAFDLALFKITKMPFIIHDSIMFKNIEVPAFENLTKIYNSFDKQIFISIDEINRFSKETIEILLNKKVVSLNAENTLFIKNWKLDTMEGNNE